MSESLRIRTTPNGGDKFLKLKLDQDFDFIEILSLKISQEEVYRRFCSDYGVIAGRVVVNTGFGVPNAKVSVFIPISDEDKLNPEMKGLYPYEIITDKNTDGVRYNLLPKYNDGNDDCYTPIGTFPSKREIIDNDMLLDVYCKYYKFTTTTNHAGDFMIFGVPTGNYMVQVDTDLSDVGLITQKPYDFIAKGTSQKLFDSPTKFKKDKNIDKLVQVKTLRAGVTVKPFWGDVDICEIGINRVDFDLQTNIVPSAIFMGSIFGENHKHSINKHCRPRKKVGNLCEQVTSEGSIEMIRKTFDGQIEQFDVEGGRVIDEDGTWAYQIPMNLDYMVTDEMGNLVPSDDENVGLPTRASVRFRIGMDETGGEGRLRTRAKHLVPNNPSNTSEIDYTFGDNTSDVSFRDLYWNKIYTVKNFIARFQTVCGPTCVDNRHIVGIKNVDDCVGTHNPFPYNRIDTDFNPLFTIICIILSIIISIIALVNGILIKLINTMIGLINDIIDGICSIINGIVDIACSALHPADSDKRDACKSDHGCSLQHLNYIPCITLKCDGGNGDEIYAPGCSNTNKGFDAAQPPTIDHWAAVDGSPNDGHDGHDKQDAGLKDCYALQIADALDLWELDFYNDWVNGTLYAFLLKYKKRRKGKIKFCEYDCDDFAGGTDGNADGTPDNKCRNNFLVDSCAYNEAKDTTNQLIRDGLVKKVDDELYYASYTHQGDKLLYASDIVHLGSIFDCDWQGIPKLQQGLVATSYKVPDLLSEYDDAGNKVQCGMSSTGSNGHGDGLFFEINCIGLKVEYPRCWNIKKLSEIGVDTTNYDDSPLVIASCDVDSSFIDYYGHFWRDYFYALNVNGPEVTSAVRPSTSVYFNGGGGATSTYWDFRKFDGGYYNQPHGNSFYFYFGIKPGKSALDKMNNKYFWTCKREIEPNFDVSGVVTHVTTIGGNNGTITISVLGNATAPYTYSWVGPSGFVSTSQNLTGLVTGTYTVTVTDSLGLTATGTFNVNQPQAVYCDVDVNSNATLVTSFNGSIILTSIGGGVPPYTYNVSGPIGPFTGPATNNVIVSGLCAGTYTSVITDSIGGTCTTTGLTITSAPLLVASATSTNNICYASNTAAITTFATGGTGPYSFVTNGTTYNGTSYSSVLQNPPALYAGTYTVTVTDTLGQTVVMPLTITQDAQLTLAATTYIQCDPTRTFIKYDITDPNTSGPWTITANIDGVATTLFTYTGITSTSFMFEFTCSEPTNTYDVTFTNSRGCKASKAVNRSATPRPTQELKVLNTTQPAQCSSTTTNISFNISDDSSYQPFTVRYSAGTTYIGSVVYTTTGVKTISGIPTTGTPNFHIEATNARPCASDVLTITAASVARPASNLSGSLNKVNNTPFIGQATLSASPSGGWGSYTYLWSNGSTASSTVVTMGSGTYSVTITDLKGCTWTASIAS